ncbi:hypothetical protein [Tannerella sp.]|uniref:hypothetical protein n=1 Tax=Tannerella sp. TaxID=2382127 RepID=UPI0026DD3838|nr:hypothetical protein [Tannerella sp.]MDO4703208.1 hypothetical protein [Tannerella sp.]
MKIKTFLSYAFFLLLMLGATGCEKKSSEEESHISCPCECVEEKVHIMELKDETLYVQYNSFLKKYVLVSKSKEEAQGKFQIPIVPCENDIPDRYKQEDLPVIVSGQKFDCSEYYKPNARYYHRFYIQLSSIKRYQLQNTTP